MKIKMNGTITVEIGSDEHNLLAKGDTILVAYSGVQASFKPIQREVTKNARQGLAVFDLKQVGEWTSSALSADKKTTKAPAKKKAAPKKKSSKK